MKTGTVKINRVPDPSGVLVKGSCTVELLSNNIGGHNYVCAWVIEDESATIEPPFSSSVYRNVNLENAQSAEAFFEAKFARYGVESYEWIKPMTDIQ